MGHSVIPDRTYRLLQQRLDRNNTGAPDSSALMKILRLLFSPDEAEVARRIPGWPTPLDELSSKLGIPREELGDSLTAMARRGVVMDFEQDGRRYFMLPPVVIGFFEFVFMRSRDDLPMNELARLFDQYMHQNERFARSVFQGQTQPGRSLVREEALPEGDHTEILDWERTSHIIESASAIGVSLCSCRHKASHTGNDCASPKRACLSLNYAAESLIRSGNAERIGTAEAVRILEECKEAGLAQTGDNVQRNLNYICNCCSCCCEMMRSIRFLDISTVIVSSNWIMEVDESRCTGCGKCAEVCPIKAIQIAEEMQSERKRKWAVRAEDVCLGCGVCYTACTSGAISLRRRPQRVFTPETVFDKAVAMAIERGKLANLLFNDPDRLSHRALGRIMNILEKSPPFKAAMAVQPLRSTFMNALVKGARARVGETVGFLT